MYEYSHAMKGERSFFLVCYGGMPGESSVLLIKDRPYTFLHPAAPTSQLPKYSTYLQLGPQ